MELDVMESSRFATTWQRFSSSQFGRWLGLADLSGEVADDEPVSRFLRRTDFAPTKGRVKPSGLLPRWNADHNRFETSTHRSGGLGRDQVWALAYRYIENLDQKRRLHGRGHCLAAIVTSQALSFDVYGEPYPRHADIAEWPVEEHEQLMLATNIANAMTLDLDPKGGVR